MQQRRLAQLLLEYPLGLDSAIVPYVAPKEQLVDMAPEQATSEAIPEVEISRFSTVVVDGEEYIFLHDLEKATNLRMDECLSLLKVGARELVEIMRFKGYFKGSYGAEWGREGGRPRSFKKMVWTLYYCACLYFNTLLQMEMSVVASQYVGGEELNGVAPPEAAGIPNIVKGRFEYTGYEAGFESVWSPLHISPSRDSVSLTLDRSSGAGIRSKEAFLYGFFSATLKLPDNYYSAGVVTTFYISNAKLYPKEHDEVDFEFLGRVHGEKYVLQTNMYLRGNTSIGREQRLNLWFDPSKDFHSYSILWTPHHIVYYVDNVPIRELVQYDKLRELYPSRPLHVYGTIWDGSSWATNGGKDKVDYKFSPFVATYKDFVLSGCVRKDDDEYKNCSSDNQMISKVTGKLPPKLSDAQIESMHWVQRHYMTYDYCEDHDRYPAPLPECQKQKFKSYKDEL
ncbi:hypothetical protein L7F22_034513 [Adiantum nelumboides]|nr:hypothetical protein [Adiantum nelumboides]